VVRRLEKGCRNGCVAPRAAIAKMKTLERERFWLIALCVCVCVCVCVTLCYNRIVVLHMVAVVGLSVRVVVLVLQYNIIVLHQCLLAVVNMCSNSCFYK
jgi:hypothetical protein